MENNISGAFAAARAGASVHYFEALASAAVIIMLVLAFAGYMPMSGDFALHFILVDTLTRYGNVPPGTTIGVMAGYPPGAHWLASVLGRIAGSSVTGIVMASIVALYLCNRMLLRLAGNSMLALLVFCALFAAAASWHSTIGWELFVNFFYPQLVGDVILLGALLWLGSATGNRATVAIVAVAATVSMWIQPLIAVHILGIGLTLSFLHAAIACLREKRFAVRAFLPVALLAAIAASLLAFHPAMQAMRAISENDGYLVFGYSSISMVISISAGLALINLWCHIARDTDPVDMVLGAAGVASALIALMQLAALFLAHAGSPYAVKKHMFIVFTIGMLNLTRLICASLRDTKQRSEYAGLAAPLIAAVMSIMVLRCYTSPTAPVIAAVDYANEIAYRYKPGELVSDIEQPAMINFMISQTALRHPWGMTSIGWLQGTDPVIGATLVMAPRAQVRPDCVSGNDQYVIAKPSCLTRQK